MIYIPANTSISLVQVVDAGIPNKECIVLHTNESVNLAAYGMLLGYKVFEAAEPIVDEFFWLSDVILDAKTWVYLFTGTGNPRFTKTETNEPAYLLYWNKKNVVFTDMNVVPLLIGIGGLDVGKNGRDLNLIENPSQ